MIGKWPLHMLGYDYAVPKYCNAASVCIWPHNWLNRVLRMRLIVEVIRSVYVFWSQVFLRYYSSLHQVCWNWWIIYNGLYNRCQQNWVTLRRFQINGWMVWIQIGLDLVSNVLLYFKIDCKFGIVIASSYSQM